MNEARRWQTLPTIVELTEGGERKKEIARKMAEMLEGADGGPPSVAAPPEGWSVEALVREFRFGGDEVPTLIGSAAPLLNLAHALRHTEAPPDIEELRRTTMDAIDRYERDLASARISPERARAAHYVVCATVDDVVLSKGWGVRAGWARSGLVSTFHMDVTGGDRVFDLLDHFHQRPGANKDLLLLIYLCLSLAFEGRTRVSPRGLLELGRCRDSLYKTLIAQYSTFERELSPNWRGVSARHQPLRTAAALWTLVSALMLLFALGYLGFTVSLNGASDSTFAHLANLPPIEVASVYVPPRPAPPPSVVTVTPKPPPPLVPTHLQNFLTFLKPEVDKRLVSLSNDRGRILVRINDAGLFAIGSATVAPDFHDLLERIGGALAVEKFRALVVGYTDNTPIKTVEFPSNWHLSEARAAAVGKILASFTGPAAISTEGRGDADPIASNDTEDGRKANRRTEILVLSDPSERLDPSLLAPIRNEASATHTPQAGGSAP